MVAETVYVPLAVIVFEAEEVLLPPLQTYVLPPDAVSVKEEQEEAFPAIAATGNGFTVTFLLVVPVHPLLLVTVTVYAPLVLKLFVAEVALFPPLHE